MDRSAPAITLEPRDAALPRALLAAVMLLALGAIAMTRIPGWAQGLLAACVLLQALDADRMLRRGAALRLVLRPGGDWLARDAGGDAVVALRDHAIVGPLVALRFAAPARPPDRVVLLPGMVPSGTLRELRAWLRHGYGSS